MSPSVFSAETIVTSLLLPRSNLPWVMSVRRRIFPPDLTRLYAFDMVFTGFSLVPSPVLSFPFTETYTASMASIDRLILLSALSNTTATLVLSDSICDASSAVTV